MERNKVQKTLQTLWGRYKYILLVVLAGAALLLWPTGEGETAEESGQAEASVSQEEALDRTEQRMKEILSRIDGVGEVELMLTLESTEQREFAMDTELSYSGQTASPDDYTRRSETVVVSGKDGDSPVVVKNVSPVYRGALVVCQGGGNGEVKLAVTQAVAALTGLSSDRITVVKWTS
jgi:stage III sporulation protein AG